LRAVAELYKLGLEVEVLTWTDDEAGVPVSKTVWLIARWLYDQSDVDFLDWIGDVARQFDGDVVEARRHEAPQGECRGRNTARTSRACDQAVCPLVGREPEKMK
jgi:hypothetical protein